MLVLAIAITALTVVYLNGILENDANAITESVAEAETVKINELLSTVESSVRLMENYTASTLDSQYALASGNYLASYNADG